MFEGVDDDVMDRRNRRHQLGHDGFDVVVDLDPRSMPFLLLELIDNHVDGLRLRRRHAIGFLTGVGMVILWWYCSSASS